MMQKGLKNLSELSKTRKQNHARRDMGKFWSGSQPHDAQSAGNSLSRNDLLGH